jgi:cell division protease FtsH
MQRSTEDRFLITREELKSRMAVLLAGRIRGTDVWADIDRRDDLSRLPDIARRSSRDSA